jgi:bla regulator protein BlaR1
MTDWLLDTLLATSGLIVLVLLLREPVRRHFGARAAYALWLIPVSRLFMPTLTDTVERAEPVSMPAPFEPVVTAEPLLLAANASRQPTLLDQIGGWPNALLILWLGLALGLFVMRMLAFQRQRSAILSDASEIASVGAIRIVRSAEVSGPVAFGMIDRIIAVPADFERIYDARERRLALEHELAHHRSGDLVINLFALILLCLQWFNPLAWIAHAAFRFDQEAACDARVLDKVKADDRANYGRAIAKAASGRALLFASALDQRNTLHRRLKSMLSNPNPGQRLTGQLLVLGAIAVALPLTATRAIEYVDIAAPAPLAAQATAVTAQPAVAADPAAPIAPAAPVAPLDIDREGAVMINGHARQWRDLTPAEKNEVRRSIAEAKADLARTHIDREEIQREIREAMAEARIDKEELRRELAEARVEIDEAMREIDAHAVEIRRAGQDPEAIKVQVRASLKAVEAIDVEAITRNALAAVDQAAIEASVAAAEASIAKAQAEVERIEERFQDD